MHTVSVVSYPSFWKKLGSYMSKVSNEEKSMIHFMESNVCGNKQGEEVREETWRHTKSAIITTCSCCSTSKPPCILTKSKFWHQLSLDHLVSECNSKYSVCSFTTVQVVKCLRPTMMLTNSRHGNQPDTLNYVSTNDRKL